MEIKDKVAIVTGASRGMGRAIAKLLVAEGARVALIAKNESTLQAVVAEIEFQGGQALALPTDITSAKEVEAMVQTVVSHFHRIDILVNNAFWGPPASLEATTEELWDRTIDTTLKGPYLCTRAVFAVMKKQHSGRIINIGSLAGKIGEDNRTAYCAAKWGLEGLTAALSVEMLKYNIHVHLISPAATYTSFWDENMPNIDQSIIDKMIPVQTIAETVCWVIKQPDQVHIPDVPVYNYRNCFEITPSHPQINRTF
jgi:3-oxoacyl-[acyl-carrier protein] reductase